MTMYSVIYGFHPVPMLGDQFLTVAYAKTLFSKEQNFRFIDLHVSVCLCIIVMYMQVPGKSRRGCGIPGAGMTGYYKPPNECWDTGSGSLQVEEALSTAEPPLQPPEFNFLQTQNTTGKNSCEVRLLREKRVV